LLLQNLWKILLFFEFAHKLKITVIATLLAWWYHYMFTACFMYWAYIYHHTEWPISKRQVLWQSASSTQISAWIANGYGKLLLPVCHTPRYFYLFRLITSPHIGAVLYGHLFIFWTEACLENLCCATPYVSVLQVEI
jgi:signal transduction histidine kinase